MTYLVYLVPVVAIVVIFVLSRGAQKRALAGVANMSPEQARASVNAYYATSFELAPGESLKSVWISEEYQGSHSTGRQVAGAALNSLAGAAVGVKAYVPQVRIGLTTLGRVLFAREFSELGNRGHFKQALALDAGTQALDAATSHPGEALNPPLQNPMGGGAPPEFVQFRSPSGQIYEVWVTAGQTMGGAAFIPTFNGLTSAAA
jgi:hypothetical protein